MTRAELIRRHAHECELRARALADQASLDPDAAQASDVEAITARVLLELAEVEEEAEAA